MKTNLPEAITTIAQAKAFLRELHSNRELSDNCLLTLSYIKSETGFYVSYSIILI